jgi:hypothetical protein
MSTRQLRLSDIGQIKDRLNGFVGKSISIVLKDNTAQTGLLETVSGTTIVLRNMRLKKMNYAIDQITELYFDTTTN